MMSVWIIRSLLSSNQCCWYFLEYRMRVINISHFCHNFPVLLVELLWLYIAFTPTCSLSWHIRQQDMPVWVTTIVFHFVLPLKWSKYLFVLGEDGTWWGKILLKYCLVFLFNLSKFLLDSTSFYPLISEGFYVLLQYWRNAKQLVLQSYSEKFSVFHC